ncbi:hypothetical protein Awo_c34190 [Acetobacterium woodii DSM 1030]|uniref:Uncharacterized protein n=1 Tax=Acetobacterium woodii (strain ATCC 29683 / DSM 1030 / JCM 2381 / KCTC 1655 / WB1) TaxID=931626 RepID=H6LBM2_ACEWD|nr:hypothetical protein Awo_c34190 [Acetobacterium woodii DSM 1030]
MSTKSLKDKGLKIAIVYLHIDTGLGICNIYDEVIKLTNSPIAAVATHIHCGHKEFLDFYAHEDELNWSIY